MGSVLEEGSYMEHNSMLAGNSLLTKGTRIPTGEVPIYILIYFNSNALLVMEGHTS